MINFLDAIWDGIYANFALYALFNRESAEAPTLRLIEGPDAVSSAPFHLQDELAVLDDNKLFIYDIKLTGVPKDITGFLMRCSEILIADGACACWFSFDGGFSFEHFLSPEGAEEVYFLRSANEVAAAIEDEVRSSNNWKQKVSEFRAVICS